MVLSIFFTKYGIHNSGQVASLPNLRFLLDELKIQQADLVDKELENMDDPDLNTQLKALEEGKQDSLERIAVL